VAAAPLKKGRGQTRRTGLAVAAGLAAQLLLIEQGLKHLVARQRPFAAMGLELRDGLLDAGSYSFPSGHSMASFLAAWIVTVRFPRWRIPLLALAVLIGLSRVHLGAHYPGDVLAGAVLGILFGTTIARLLRLEAVRPLAQVPACAEGTDG
jgi:undecaprenyl-diphosphatase